MNLRSRSSLSVSPSSLLIETLNPSRAVIRIEFPFISKRDPVYIGFESSCDTAKRVLFIIDLIFTVVSLTHLDERLDALRKDMELTVQTLIENVEQSRHDFEEIMELWKENDHESYRQWVHEKSMMERRIVKAFPMLMKHQGKEEKEDGKK